MALVTNFTCAHCREPRYELVTTSRICASCRTAVDKADTAAHMAKLAAMPLEERDAERRIAALESHHIRY